MKVVFTGTYTYSYNIYTRLMCVYFSYLADPRSTLFRFCVKFYPPDPALLQEEYTR